MEYRIVRSARKTICIQLSPAGDVIVRAPRRCPGWYIDQFVMSKARWIERHQTQLLTRNDRRDAFKMEDGFRFSLMGEPVTVRICPGEQADLAERTLILPDGDVDRNRTAILALCRTYALPLLRERLERWALRMGLVCRELKLSNARTRWGSCSRDGVIRISVWLLFAPDPAIDYVLVHELSHLRHFDHSAAFWREVAAVLPDYLDRKRLLRAFQEEPFLQALANKGSV